MSKMVGCRVSDEDYEVLVEYCRTHKIKHYADAIRHFINEGLHSRSDSKQTELALLSEIKEIVEYNLRISAAGLSSVAMLRDSTLNFNKPIDERKKQLKAIFTESFFMGEMVVSKDKAGDFKEEK